MESKDISRLSSSRFKSRWKRPLSCVHSASDNAPGWCGCGASVTGTDGQGPAWELRALLLPPLLLSPRQPAGHSAPWLQVVWDALDHLGILSSQIFFPGPLRWFYSLLSTDLGGRGGSEGAWVVLFCLLHWACKVVSELTGWNWELLWSLFSISQPLKSKEREGTRAFHGFSANINKVTFLGSSRRERSGLTKNDLLSEFFLRSKHEIEANGCFAWLQTYFCTRLAEGSAARGSRLTKLELVKWGYWLKSD